MFLDPTRISSARYDNEVATTTEGFPGGAKNTAQAQTNIGATEAV